MAGRFFAIIIFFSLLYGLLGFKIYNLQIEKSLYYVQKAQARNEALKEQITRRGQIFFTDRSQNAIPASLNRDFPIIYAVPKEIPEADIEKTAEILNPIVNLTVEELKKILNDRTSLYKLLVSKAGDSQVQQIKEIRPLGVYIDYAQYRFYPFQNLAAQTLGFVGLNQNIDKPTGLYGLEKYYQERLTSPRDLQLTIDRNIQAEAEMILNNLIDKFAASGGSVIVEEPATGKILALAGKPDFDPNTYGKFPLKNFINPAVQYIYEAGSIFKPVTMAIGIEHGLLTPETVYFDKGSVTLNGKTITNWDKKAYGKTTMLQVIENSINTGAVFAESKIGHQLFYKSLNDFGFSEKTGIDLPDEVAGDLKNLSRKSARDIDFATASFGQGTAITPIELINFYAALANNGVMMQPYLNNELKPKIVKRIISEQTSQTVMQMMESAVEKAQVAAIPYYRIAGKTGTAQVPDFQKGGYTETYIHSFAGLAPASQPRFVALIKLDQPNVTLAGATVVPAFKELAQYIINYYNIPPDKLAP